MNSIRRHHFMVLFIILMVMLVFVTNVVAVENINDLNQELAKQQTPVPKIIAAYFGISLN
jgi:hypothetical protein